MSALGRLSLRVTPLALLLVAWLAAVSPAHAIEIGCRSDPLIILSNGAIIDLSADIAAVPWEVEEVVYVLHAPVGTSVVAVIPTPSWPTTIERFYFYADNPPGQYTSTTTVYTEDEGVDVTANLIYSIGLLRLGIDAEPGVAGETIQLQFPN